MPGPSVTRSISRAAFEGPLGAQFPPVLTVPQFAALMQVPVRTAKSWIQKGYLDGVTRRMGKHRRIWRDLAIERCFSEGFGK